MQFRSVEELPSVLLTDRLALPNISAVYIVYTYDGIVLYIGASINLRNRLAKHPKARPDDLEDYVRVGYLQCEQKYLREVEAALIRHYQPLLNSNYTGKRYTYYSSRYIQNYLEQRRSTESTILTEQAA